MVGGLVGISWSHAGMWLTLRQPRVLIGAGSFFLLAAAIVLLQPPAFLPLLVASSIAVLAFLAFQHTIVCSVIWLVLAGATLEMTLADIFGLGWFQPTIAAVKAAELGLAVICVLRYGPTLDLFNPGIAFGVMFLAGLAHGLHPGLSVADSLRSLAGSVAPFAFSFSRLSRRWAQAMIRTTAWIPLLTVAAGALLDLAGLRPLFYDSFGARLGGMGHPAFLAGFCVAAIYACLIELYRAGQSRFLLLLAANFVILLLTGARAPLACAAAVTGLTLVFVRSPTFPRRCRILPLLLSLCLLPPLAVLAYDLPTVRLFNVLTRQAGNLSGREMLWPLFERAADASPWFGWGIGAGNAIIPPDSELARQMQTWAAHNEYLRILVEGGQFGRLLLVALFIVWVLRHTALLCRTDRAIMRLVFLAFAAHAYTDNVLIASTACVFFAFAAAVFARGAREREAEVAASTPTRRLLHTEQVA